MALRLLDQQASLLEYLSSPAALFGDEANVPLDAALQGIDLGVLRLQARFACNKRIEKIIEVFPRTLEILGADQGLILREFAEAIRPTTRSSLANARQFQEFLSARWREDPPKPAYLPDVLACELAIVEASNLVDDNPTKVGKGDEPKWGIRRHRSVVPLRCAHDVRSIFEGGLRDVVPPKRDTPLVVTLPAGACEVRLFEVAPVVFDVLAQLDDWADPSRLCSIGDLENLVNHLAEHKLIDVRP